MVARKKHPRTRVGRVTERPVLEYSQETDSSAYMSAYIEAVGMEVDRSLGLVPERWSGEPCALAVYMTEYGRRRRMVVGIGCDDAADADVDVDMNLGLCFH